MVSNMWIGGDKVSPVHQKAINLSHPDREMRFGVQCLSSLQLTFPRIGNIIKLDIDVSNTGIDV